MSIAQNYPIVSPALSLDFANVQALDPRITFARATTATYYGTRTALAEQNLLLQSQTFENASWTKQGAAVTADTTTAPDGTTTADTLTATASTLRHLNQQTITGVASSAYTLSVYLKYSNNQYVSVQDYDGAYKGCIFDVQNGTVGSTSVGVAASIQSVGSGWYRCIVTFTHAVATKYLAIQLQPSDVLANIGAQWTAVGTEAVFLWGAQVEQRSTVTAYQVTTTQPVTNYVPVLETAASGVARFDHNPVTFESLGLLIEEQRTNLLTYSEQFDNAAWNKINSTVTANQIIAPDGTLSGELLTDNATNGGHSLQSPSLTTTVQSYTLSVYAKASSLSKIMLYGLNADGKGTGFDLSNGTTFTVTGIPLSTSSSIVAVGNGWYRCSIVFTGTATTGNVGGIYTVSGTTFSYAGTGQSVFVWGAQLEAGSFSTSYIPTVASQVTRAADSASMTGANFSSWYNQAEGSVYCEVTTPVPASTTNPGFMWYATEGIGNNRIELRQLGSGDTSPRINTLFRVSAVTTVNISLQTNTIGWTTNNVASAKISLGYKVNDVYLTSDKANAPATDLDTTMPSINQVLFSHTGNYKMISYYPIRLSNTNLQALTG